MTLDGGVANMSALLHERVSATSVIAMLGYRISVSGRRAADSVSKYSEREHLLASFVGGKFPMWAHLERSSVFVHLCKVNIGMGFVAI